MKKDPWKLRAIVEAFREVDTLMSISDMGRLMKLRPKANSLSNLMYRLYKEGVLGRTRELDEASMNAVYRYYLLHDDFTTYKKTQLQNVQSQLVEGLDKLNEEKDRLLQKIDVTKFALKILKEREQSLTKPKSSKAV
jgi:hypothetical protein